MPLSTASPTAATASAASEASINSMLRSGGGISNVESNVADSIGSPAQSAPTTDENGKPVTEPAVLSTANGNSKLQSMIQDHQTNMSNVSTATANNNGTTSGNTDTTKTAPVVSDATKTAIENQGGVTADEATIAGISQDQLKNDYTYDPSSGYFIPNAGTDDSQVANEDASYTADQKTINDAFSAQTMGMDAATASLVDSLKSMYADRVTQQQGINNASEAATNTSNIRNGTSRYAGGVATGFLTADENEGLQRIASIQDELANAVATAESNLQDKKYTAFVDQMNQIQNLRNEHTSTLQNLQKMAIDKQESDRTFAQTQAQNEVTNQLNSDKFDLEKSQDTIDNALKQGALTEQEAKDASDEANQKAQTQIAEAELGIKQATFNATYGMFMNSDGTPNTTVKPSDLPGYTPLSNGSAYLNGASLPKNPDGSQVQQIGGIPVISTADQPIVANADSVQALLTKVQGEFQSISGESDFSNDKQGGTNSPAVEQYKADVTALNAALKGLSSGSSSRFSNLGSITLSPIVGNLKDQVFGGSSSMSTQLSTIQENLNGGLKAINQYITTPMFGQTFKTPAAADAWAEANGQANVISTLQKAYPEATAADILNMINTGDDGQDNNDSTQ